MRNIIYVFAVILIALWATGFFFYHIGDLIHILLVIAVISILLNVIRGKDSSSNSIN